MPPVSSLPRRQSCDRCHVQKVRCIQDPSKAQLSREEDETAPGKAAVPCTRCKKAGTTCFYSLQLPAGRPSTRRDMLQRPVHIRSPQKVAHACSPRFSSQSLDSTPVDPLLLHPDANGDNTAAFQEITEDMVLYGHESSAALEAHTTSHLHESTDNLWHLDSATSTMPSGSQQSHAGFNLDYIPEHEKQAELGIDYISRPELQAKLYPDNIEDTLEELTELSQRCYRAARMVTTSEATLTATSSEVNEVANTTTALVRLSNRLVQEQGKQPRHYPHQPGADTSTDFSPYSQIEQTPDLQVILMALGCYYRLLSTFEAICASICSQFSRDNTITLETTPQLTPPSISQIEFSLGSAPQAVMILKLISYLLQRLDRAFGPLAALIDGRSSKSSDRPHVDPYISPSMTSRSQSRSAHRNRYHSCQHADENWDSHSQIQQQDTYASNELASSVVSAMQGHRSRIETQMKRIEHLIEQSDDL
ncbi:hypothetical protein F5884DRAFT_873879 [Xylogone sp. PMI_703]|nr:hypothetical protein F5884DRAFT_873879 [Xylogone sp. PMI_703]